MTDYSEERSKPMTNKEIQSIRMRNERAIDEYTIENVIPVITEDVPKLLDALEETKKTIGFMEKQRIRMGETIERDAEDAQVMLQEIERIQQERRDANHQVGYLMNEKAETQKERDEWKEKAGQYREALKGIADQPEVDEGSEDADGVANYCIEEAKEALEDSK